MLPAFSRERLSSPLLEEMAPLIAEHFHEIARFKDFRVQPNFNHYQMLDDIGMLYIFTARDEGELVGYSVFNLLKHPHFTEISQAQEELLFLAPEHRNGDAGAKFIRYCDEELAKAGAAVIYHTVSMERDFSPLLVRAGYELSDKIYAKRVLGRNA